jgi:hypothetical protein
LVIYSAEPNRTASDASTDHGIFVGELIKQMRVPGLTIREVFNRTQAGVNTASQGDQLPSISTSLTDDFSLMPAQPSQPQPPPTIMSITPTLGSSAGGTSVNIVGTNFSGTTGVTFADAAAGRFTVNSATSITATTPAHAVGLVDVAVTTPVGTAKAKAIFSYVLPPLQAKPAIIGVAPASGEIAGGVSVTITGTNLAETSSVTFGGTRASAFAVNSATSITAITPAHAAGAVDVAASAPQGTATVKSAFIYTSATPAASPRRLCGNDPELSDLNAHLQQNPNDVAALYRRGLVCAKNNDFMPAITDFDEVLRRNPKDADALNNSCWVRAIVGDLDTALKQCDAALQLRPRNADALDSRGMVNLKLSLYTAAISDYDSALKLNPKQASSLYGRGIAKLRSGRASDGNNDIAAAKAIRPGIAAEFGGYGIR